MRDTIDRLAAFEGDLEDALVHTVPLDGPVDVPGIPIGISDDPAKSPVGVDFTMLRHRDDRISNKSIGLIGDQGIGKTFLLYVMMYIWSSEKAGAYTSSISLDSLKHNLAKLPETYPLITTLLGCKVIQVNQISLNPLSPLWDFAYDEQLDMVQTMLEIRRKRSLDELEEELLDYHLRISYYQTENPSLAKLSELVGGYRADRTEYTESQALLMEDTALRLSKSIRGLTRGKLGRIFQENANDEELLQLIEQPAKSWDFKDIPPVIRSIIETFRGTVETSALALKDPDDPESGPRHPNRVAQYIGRDEAYDAWANPIFADHEFVRMKTLRERDIALVMSFHRLADFLSSVGTNKARNVIREIPIWFVGRQHKADIKDLREFLHLPEHVLRTLPTLPKGHFWLILPGRAPRLIAVIGTRLAVQTFVTNQANLELLMGYFETGDLQMYMDWLEMTSPPIMEEDLEPEVPNDVLTSESTTVGSS